MMDLRTKTPRRFAIVLASGIVFMAALVARSECVRQGKPHASTVHYQQARDETARPSLTPSQKALPVVTLDYRGGLTPPRKSQDPYLMLYADGTAIVTDPFGNTPRIARKMSPREIDAIVSFAVKDHGFLRLESKQFQETIQRETIARKLPKVVDLASTVINIRQKDRTHEVRCYGLFWYAKHLPDVESFQHLRAIEQRLLKLMQQLREEAK